MPKVSILIGIYNGQHTLHQALESISLQTFQDFEVICIDDGSSDQTPHILKEWRTRLNKRLIILRNEKNIGLTKSLNIGLKKAAGIYIARLDADDTWESTKLEKQVSFLEAHSDYGIVGTNHYNIYEAQGHPKPVYLPQTHLEITKKLFRRNPFAHSSILARTDLLRSVGGYAETIRYGQDYDLWLRCFPLTKFYNLQEFLCTRNVANGISVVKQNAQMRQSIRTRLRYIPRYDKNLKNYFYLLEPLAVILTPDFIKNIKRRYL